MTQNNTCTSATKTLQAEFKTFGVPRALAFLPAVGPLLSGCDSVLCVVARRSLFHEALSKPRSFFNFYDFREDPQGENLRAILLAATPVCTDAQLEHPLSQEANETGEPRESGRLMMLVEHHPLVVETILNADPVLRRWYQNERLELVVLDPENSPHWRNRFIVSAPLPGLFYTARGIIPSSCERRG